MVDLNAVCYRHSDRSAPVSCQRCDRPICASCMHAASVGFHCPECTKSGAQRVHTPSNTGAATPVTYTIMGLIAVAFLAQLVSGGGDATGGSVFQDFAMYGVRIGLLNEDWRLVTGAFLHGGVIHVAFNGYFIYSFGRFLEGGIGSVQTALVYVGGLFGGSAAVMLFDWDVPTIGASGAALGLGGGAVAIMAARGQDMMSSPLVRVLGMNLIIPLVVGGISFWGHFGGIAGGCLVGGVLGLAPIKLRLSQTQTNVLAAAAVSALAVLSVVAAHAGS